MKKIHRLIYIGMFAATAVSCKKEFLDRFPQTDVTKETFFNTPQDLETYTNTFYEYMGPGWDDINSDNISSYSGSGEVDVLVRGTINQTNVSSWGGWNKDAWAPLRRFNYMLDNVGKTTGDPVAIRHYIGIARFFRARFYMGKLERYSDVPWYNTALATNDESLYKARDTRALVADSILNDLNYAVENIKPDEGNRTRVSKWSALALLARFGLNEGTWRKYHAELNLGGDHARFLERAAWAADQLMTSGRFSINNTGKGGEDYRALFVSPTLSGNKEAIQWVDYQQALGVGNNTHTVLGWTWSLSHSLAETYLMKDGTPFTAQPGYATKDFVNIFANRDPRMAETIAPPGFSPNLDGKPYIAKPNLGGYDQVKFYPRNPSQRQGWVLNYSALPVFRYAEALLAYAEAKAELGTITQADIDKTINLLRSRVLMPVMNIAAANAQPDNALALQYPDVSGANKGLLLEIRRERRVEMACEGLRFSDLMRWKAGKRLEDAQAGMYVPALGALDVSGDGIQDIAILASPNDESPIAGLPENIKKNLAKFYLKDATGKDNNFYLKNGNSGHIFFIRDRDQPRVFIEPKYYYRPIPQDQLLLNSNLKQIFGWES
ncbi:RagB/SusD family nutrient uptake outer membrane protein [Chitinophaga barathri]|uniref:RagB/SusD family nutrient uptake outer membrane protein n=1 Tax=Chitinophaga barathri TaxID=1647451 RepID=A0A3N4N5G1_9BACT|nr:RagB/SusD family nutrient uptake outer membrane protein [Chitinophaga barathri]RPD42863.1 RagB/SusD family nutrient uptake outer membrane protein [Chitinophaga barathri]